MKKECLQDNNPKHEERMLHKGCYSEFPFIMAVTDLMDPQRPNCSRFHAVVGKF